MPTTETQNQEKKTCLDEANGEGVPANNNTTVSGKVTVVSSSLVPDTGHTNPQNAATTTAHLSVAHPGTTSTAAISPVQASAQTTTTKFVIATKGPRPISPLLVASRVSSPMATVCAQPVLARLSAPPGPVVTRVSTPSKGAVMAAVPRSTCIQQPTATVKPTQTTSVQLPANFQIPPGMVLIRSDSGQLMLVSQQALAQAQGLVARTHGIMTSTSTRPPATQVTTAVAVRKADTPVVIRMPPPPPSLHETKAQRPLVKAVGVAAPTTSTSQSQIPQPVIRPVVPVTRPGPSSLITPNKPTNTPKATIPSITPEVLENVKKCKNFLVTLIKLASSGTHSYDMAKNVRELVKSLLDGKLEPEEFTDQLYRELKSSPQPYLVPFLKKSLPVLRQLTPNPQLFIQEVDQPKAPSRVPSLLSTNARPAHLSTTSGQPIKSTPLVIQQPGGVVFKPAVTSSGPARTYMSVQNRGQTKPIVLLSGQHQNAGVVVRRTPFQVPPAPAQRRPFKESVGSLREEDDINDVASMAGVNLTEENARILATNSELVGSVVQSCCDEPFLSPGPLHTCILHTGEPVGVSEVGSDVVSLVSQATQERLRDLLERVTVVAQHRQLALKEDYRHTQTSDVRSQLRFLEELERLEKQRRDQNEREALLRVARSRCNPEDPDLQLLKQRARELQQLEQDQLQHREANLTALAAIGPRRKRPLDFTGSQVGPGGTVSIQRAAVQRVTRVSLRDLLFSLEQDPPLRHSLVLYKALLS
ncbi:hypothetical protein DPEC_G00339250 [Dallia pectoralis]|uniref:Uncharacterized protein n=1 Tax=Dallia pectoralis TaxID=75939 RepID=A0ACC2F4V7_DALPE|nr:hypothetical protein DPEC_G00339250 [Dallia pectoralis]